MMRDAIEQMNRDEFERFMANENWFYKFARKTPISKFNAYNGYEEEPLEESDGLEM